MSCATLPSSCVSRWSCPTHRLAFSSRAQQRMPRCCAKPSDADDLALMETDLEEYGAPKGSSAPSQQASSSQTREEPGGLKEAIDKFLMVDFFFVLVILFWLVAGLGERAALSSTSLLDAWYPLWPVVFQPALGVLMLGAIASGVASKMDEGKR